jgi:hypothetical protein
METYKNQTVQGKSLVMEEVVFLKCKVIDCDLYYSGGDFEWAEAQFENCRWHMRGCAQKTLVLAQLIGIMRPPQQLQVPVPSSSPKPN